MSLYHNYSPTRIFMRRAAVVVCGVLALPVMLFRGDRARFYSYLHRVWVKTSDQPVWLAQSEAAGCEFL
ncbi:membrane protein [bacteria symbiont BFo1 of Frankliniella occidentalis]|jgi:hypothetical protein|uniref:YbfA family protein n=1 Tax=Erwinia aphidicola TaxID=68334 RepID=A0ABU8DAT5_ERWAP|nr:MULTISPECIES: YbfA family protein [Erwinia]KMV69619.1 membrane protein [bacteria symbiont BFo1 of Frankliniella occidentalis]PIJ59595.1 hypothetical protein BOM23_03880 [Erwinia sp. OLMDLW33]KYP83886.1 membrane protein [bacteria symbiont BFo1 of Frankliniella occidentalis]KYP89262.1 membrane protein [bacteria symbiont BFo1 of Frankliniella occidentalis]MBD1376633.1 YbfA family protein [Erwinia aphidicola]